MIECHRKKEAWGQITNPAQQIILTTAKIEYTVNALKNENPYTMAYKCYPTLYGDKEELIGLS